VRSLIAEMRETALRAKERGGADFPRFTSTWNQGIDAYQRAVEYLVRTIGSTCAQPLPAPYLTFVWPGSLMAAGN